MLPVSQMPYSGKQTTVMSPCIQLTAANTTFNPLESMKPGEESLHMQDFKHLMQKHF